VLTYLLMAPGLLLIVVGVLCAVPFLCLGAAFGHIAGAMEKED